MSAFPVTRYRPLRTDQGGSFTETLASPVTIWGAFELYQDKPQFVTDAKNPVDIGDILEIDSDAF